MGRCVITVTWCNCKKILWFPKQLRFFGGVKRFMVHLMDQTFIFVYCSCACVCEFSNCLLSWTVCVCSVSFPVCCGLWAAAAAFLFNLTAVVPVCKENPGCFSPLCTLWLKLPLTYQKKTTQTTPQKLQTSPVCQSVCASDAHICSMFSVDSCRSAHVHLSLFPAVAAEPRVV